MTFEVPLSLLYLPLALLLYSGCLWGPRIFDDSQVEERLQEWKSWRVPLTTSRPLGWLSFWVFGRWPGTWAGYHTTSVFMHGFSAMAVERIAAAFVDDGLAFFAGLLFVAHPFAVNGTAWVMGRFSLQAGMFGLLGLAAVVHGWWFAALVLLAAAALTKEDAALYSVQAAVLSVFWRGEFLLPALLALCAIFGLWWYRHEIRVIWKNTGTDLMASIGLPVNREQPWHFFVILFGTLLRIPFWLCGAKSSPYHGTRIRVLP